MHDAPLQSRQAGDGHPADTTPRGAPVNEQEPEVASTTHSSEPSIADASLRRLAPNWIRAERLSGWIFTGLLCPAGLVFVVLGITVWNASTLWQTLLPLIWLIATSLLVWSTHWLPAMSYRAAGYIVTDRDIEIRRGIWWKTVTTIPRSRVQHTDLARGPLMRRFGIAKLVIHTAGTQHATVELPGLSKEDAERIRDHLVDRAQKPGDDSSPAPKPSEGDATDSEAHDLETSSATGGARDDG